MGGQPVRGARLPRLQDLGEAQRPGGHGARLRDALRERGDWPLHLGVTEAGPAFQGTIKSATAFGALLSKGIGDTIRVSLSAPPVEEVKVGNQILQSLNLKPRKAEIVSCPSCGRAQVDVYKARRRGDRQAEGMEVPLRVAMPWVASSTALERHARLTSVWPPAAARGQIFVQGEVIKTVPESQIVETLIEEAMRIAEDGRARRRRERWSPHRDGRLTRAAPTVTVA